MANRVNEFLENIRSLDGLKNAILCGITLSKRNNSAEFFLVTDKAYTVLEEAKAKAEAETIKLYISKQTDRFRPAYGRRLQEFPRQCIFIGTTNETQFLRDVTGNRRFWVVDTPDTPTRDLWEELTPETVALIWAEAVEIYKAGDDAYISFEVENAHII